MASEVLMRSYTNIIKSRIWFITLSSNTVSYEMKNSFFMKYAALIFQINNPKKSLNPAA